MVFTAKVVFNLILFVIWPLHFVYNAFLMNKRKKKIRDLKMLLTQVDHRWRWDRDILTDNQNESLKKIRLKANELLASEPKVEAIESFQRSVFADLKKISPEKAGVAVMKEWLELFVVVLGVVMGARALFLQPFKIPTGSMQPTLNGINFYQTEKGVNGNIFKKIFDYVNDSKRYVDVVVEEDGFLVTLRKNNNVDIGKRKNPLFFFPSTAVTIGNRVYQLPGEPEKVRSYLNLRNRKVQIDRDGRKRHFFKKGEVLARGYLELGDHLFVDRVRLNFVNPRRGDITVFVTDGIRDERGDALRGRFFIKRLVGLPGDELKIKDRQLYVKEAGKDSFTLVDGSYHRAFDRMYSTKGGYQGYSSPRYSNPQYLGNENTTFTLGPDEHFMLGDNSTNSQDSRFWGIVPRKNIVGRANFVYWPFSRRWGFADSVDPEDFDTPIVPSR